MNASITKPEAAKAHTTSLLDKGASVTKDKWGLGLSAKRDGSKERSSNAFLTTVASANVQTTSSLSQVSIDKKHWQLDQTSPDKPTSFAQLTTPVYSKP